MLRRQHRDEDKREHLDSSKCFSNSYPPQQKRDRPHKSQTTVQPEIKDSFLWALFENVLPHFILSILTSAYVLFFRMPSASTFDPARDIPVLTDKVIFVTGGTAGLGRGSILALAHHSPAEIVFSGRNKESAEALIAEAKKTNPNVKLAFLECDLSSLASVHTAAQQFLRQSSRLDVLMCNAGVMASPAGTSKDGYEVQFATNHLGHALLIKMLLPQLEATPNSRIVNLSSIAYSNAPRSGIEFATLKSDQRGITGVPFPPKAVWDRYGQSKLANLLYAKALAKHHPSVTSIAVHPGIINTGLFANVTAAAKPAAFLIQTFSHTTPVEQGHFNQVWAATCEKEELDNGAYYEPIGQKVTPKTKQAQDDALAEKLWTWTQDALKTYN